MKLCPLFAGSLLFASLPVLCANAAPLPNTLPMASATVGWLKFVVADKDGQRSLILRDAQHEYRFSGSE